MREVLHDPSGEKIVGVAEEVLRLEDGDVYGADAALRCDNSWGITHGRDLSAFPFNKKILTPMIEVPPGGMDAYVTALAEGLSYLNDDEYEIDAKYETAERKYGWWGRQSIEGTLNFYYDEIARSLVYSSRPMVLAHEDLDMTITAQRCLTLKATKACQNKESAGHMCELCTHVGARGYNVFHSCATPSHHAFCNYVEITAAEASLTLSEKIMERLEFDSVVCTHKFLASRGVFITADWMKVNDGVGSYSCPETVKLVREHVAAGHSTCGHSHPNLCWIKRCL